MMKLKAFGLGLFLAISVCQADDWRPEVPDATSVVEPNICLPTVNGASLVASITSETAGLKITVTSDNGTTALIYDATGEIETITTNHTYAAPSASNARFKVQTDGCYQIMLADAAYAEGEYIDIVVSSTVPDFGFFKRRVLLNFVQADGSGNVPANVLQINSVAAATPGAAGGVLIAGTNADFDVTANSTFSGGVTITQSTSNTSAFVVTGNGTGHGALFTSGSGATGTGFRVVSAATNGNALVLQGVGTGAGLAATGGATGAGGVFTGGATSGTGLSAAATGGSQPTDLDVTIKTGGIAAGDYGTGAITADSVAADVGLPEVTAGNAGGLLIAGTNADFDVTANVGFAGGFNITQSTSNTAAFVVTGNGTGNGATFTSGSGATGSGLYAVSAATNGNGFYGAGAGNSNGFFGTGGATGNGMRMSGGSMSGSGVLFGGAGGSSNGLTLEGLSSGAGLSSTGGATGNGATVTGGATSGHGILATGGGSGDGVRSIGTGATGDGFQAQGASGSNSGLYVLGGSTGIGMRIVGGATSGTGLSATATAGSLPTDFVWDILATVQACDSGSTTTCVDTARTEADTNYWKGAAFMPLTGTSAGQARCVTGFVAETDTLTFKPALTQAITTNSYQLVRDVNCNGVAP